MNAIRAKKHLGQHFLTDKGIAARIVDSLTLNGCDSLLEVGPGEGILTTFLLKKDIKKFSVIEVDPEAIGYLANRFPGLDIINGDFLKFDLNSFAESKLAVIGNFPYGISNQILFRMIESKDIIGEMVGMFQKEVAERICSGPGSRKYGILSVLLKIYYDIEYLFTVPPSVFKPVPKVISAVVRIRRNSTIEPQCDERLLFRVVKATFNQRRKMIRNSLKSAFEIGNNSHDFFTKRPEQLGLDEFVELTRWVEAVTLT